jgi:hypothetical protein
MAQPMGTSWFTLRTAIVIDENVVILAIDTSKWFAVSGIISPRVMVRRCSLAGEIVGLPPGARGI